jgi:hypothetical protein
MMDIDVANMCLELHLKGREGCMLRSPLLISLASYGILQMLIASWTLAR